MDQKSLPLKDTLHNTNPSWHVKSKFCVFDCFVFLLSMHARHDCLKDFDEGKGGIETKQLIKKRQKNDNKNLQYICKQTRLPTFQIPIQVDKTITVIASTIFNNTNFLCTDQYFENGRRFQAQAVVYFQDYCT